MLEDEIQRTIEAGRFGAAIPLIEHYGQYVVQKLIAAKNPQERDEIAGRACAFLHDRLHLARVMRSHIATQLKTTSRVVSYSNIPSIESTWRVEG